ncbi:MAG TPA: DUF4197 family protein [Opitutaceae bacterium]
MTSSSRSTTLLILALFGGAFAHAAETPKTTSPASATTAATASAALKAAGITPSQLLGGTKTGLGTILDMAATELAKPGAVQVAPPSSMAKLLGLAQKVNQSGAIDSFKSSLSAAAASVMPQTTAVLKESLSGLSLDDAMALTSGAPDSATKLLRKAAEPALKSKVMPLIAQAIAANGTAAKAKELASKAGPMAAMLGVPSTSDLESYLYSQVLDTTFSYLAKGEAAVRANPAQLKDAIAAKVFSLGKK